MTTDDILRMAREAGFGVGEAGEVFVCRKPAVERFFRLAYAAGAAAEREECAKVCDEVAGMLLSHRYRDGAEVAVSLRDSIRARGKT